jgi:N-methylhydantoinase A/oxoprolinase/acetone carboxylase beta subunit
VWTADIDVGGTLTDGLFTSGDDLVSVKVDTTPHDLTVCLFDCLSQAASKLDFPDSFTFLENVELIRWSTTITSNVLAELRGPRVGLLITHGHEKDLYGTDRRSPVLGKFLNERDVIGINGNVTDTEIMNAARSLLEAGVRRICISLEGAQKNPARELAFKKIIDHQYPDHFLGSVPVLLGSEISQSPDDRTRTYCALINAYTHGALAATLFKAEDELRGASKYLRAFLVSHINGGVAGIAKTKAIETIESGPILGILGSSHVAKSYGLNDVVAMDVGGTTAKISVLRRGEPIYHKPSDLFGNPIEVSLPYLRSIALGGGSVVKPVAGRQPPSVQLGPESTGSFPGPACYGLGGDQATLTDAFVAAGLIDPEYFLGGSKPINLDLARGTIEVQVAKPLQLSLGAACKLIIDTAFAAVAKVIAEAQKELGINVASHTLFAYGGNGGLFGAGVAANAGIKRVQVFSLGPVFSAFGSSVSDICHVYERPLSDASASSVDLQRIGEELELIKAECSKDLLGEGIRPEGINFSAEFEATLDGQNFLLPLKESDFSGEKQFHSALAKSLGDRAASASNPVSLELLRVRATKPIPKPNLTDRARKASDPSRARMGSRKVYWGSVGGEAEIFRWESLEPGNQISGCAIVEGANTTYLVPSGWIMEVDGFGNATLSQS